MLKQKRLKKQLGDGYFFEQRLSAAVVKNLLDMLGGSNHFLIAASLTVGVVKLDAVVYWNNGKYSLGYDLMVKDMPESEFMLSAWGGYALFRSSYLQSEFILNREKGNIARMREILAEEKELALLMYDLMQKSSLIGYEAANHYYFSKGQLAEKIINCHYIMDIFTKKNQCVLEEGVAF